MLLYLLIRLVGELEVCTPRRQYWNGEPRSELPSMLGHILSFGWRGTRTGILYNGWRSCLDVSLWKCGKCLCFLAVVGSVDIVWCGDFLFGLLYDKNLLHWSVVLVPTYLRTLWSHTTWRDKVFRHMLAYWCFLLLLATWSVFLSMIASSVLFSLHKHLDLVTCPCVSSSLGFFARERVVEAIGSVVLSSRVRLVFDWCKSRRFVLTGTA